MTAAEPSTGVPYDTARKWWERDTEFQSMRRERAERGKDDREAGLPYDDRYGPDFDFEKLGESLRNLTRAKS